MHKKNFQRSFVHKCQRGRGTTQAVGLSSLFIKFTFHQTLHIYTAFYSYSIDCTLATFAHTFLMFQWDPVLVGGFSPTAIFAITRCLTMDLVSTYYMLPFFFLFDMINTNYEDILGPLSYLELHLNDLLN